MTQEARDAAPREMAAKELYDAGVAWARGVGSIKPYKEAFTDACAKSGIFEPDPSPAAAGQESDADRRLRMKPMLDAIGELVRTSTVCDDQTVPIDEETIQSLYRKWRAEQKAYDEMKAERDRLRSELAARTGKVSGEAVLAAELVLNRVKPPVSPANVSVLSIRAALEAAAPFMPAEPSLLPGLRRAHETLCEQIAETPITAGSAHQFAKKLGREFLDEIAAVSAQTEQEGGDAPSPVQQQTTEHAYSPAPQAPSTSCGAKP